MVPENDGEPRPSRDVTVDLFHHAVNAHVLGRHKARVDDSCKTGSFETKCQTSDMLQSTSGPGDVIYNMLQPIRSGGNFSILVFLHHRHLWMLALVWVLSESELCQPPRVQSVSFSAWLPSQACKYKHPPNILGPSCRGVQ